MPDYVTLAEFESYVAAEMGATDAAHRASALAAAEAAVNQYCQRTFAVVAANATPTARTFVPDGTPVLRIHDARAVTAVSIDGTALSATDYQLEPTTVSLTGRSEPYCQIRRLYVPWLVITPGYASVSVTARWGWAAVPAEVVEATKILGKDILQQRRTIGNMAQAGDFGGRVTMNTYVRQLLTPLRRAESWGIG